MWTFWFYIGRIQIENDDTSHQYFSICFWHLYQFVIKLKHITWWLLWFIDLCLKNMKIVQNFVSDIVALQIVTKYDINILCLLLLHVLFPLNPIKASTKPTMINDDDFFKANCIKWWCNLVHFGEWGTIVLIVIHETNRDWKPINLVGKSCFAISKCFFLSSLSPWYYGITN